MRIRLIPLSLALGVLFLLAVACGDASTPTGIEQQDAPALINAVAVQYTSPAILEPRLLKLDLPTTVRVGDTEGISLTLALDRTGSLVPSVEAQAVPFSDVYATHNVVAEAHLELAGVEVLPAGVTSQPLRLGEDIAFHWNIQADAVGRYTGTLWFHLRFVSKMDGSESELAVAALPVEIEAVSLLGMGGSPARWLGLFGTFVGVLLGIPLLEEIFRWVWDRYKRSKIL